MTYPSKYSAFVLIAGLLGASAIEMVIIDTDPGGDDAMALMLALKRNDNLKILGITTVNGNSNVYDVTENVLIILNVTGRLDVPVYLGRAIPLSSNAAKTDHFYGYDGLCDFDFPRIPFENHVNFTPAAEYLADMVERYPGEINVIALGPLTNIAIASILNYKFFHQVKHIYILGGSFPGQGTLGMDIEFNIAIDPESARLVFERFPVRRPSPAMTVLPAGSVQPSSLEWRLNVLGTKPLNEITILNKAQECSFNLSGNTWPGYSDYALIGAILEPSSVIDKYVGALSIKANGSSVVMKGGLSNAMIISQMNETRLETFYYDTFRACHVGFHG